MSIAQVFSAELQHECSITRKYFERLPEDKFDFAPHAKSMKLGPLAGHLSEVPGWTRETVTLDELVFDPANYVPFLPATRAEILAKLDTSLAAALAALEGASDEHLMKPWRMLMGGQLLFELPRVAVLRSMVMNHLVHHRAQLGVYLRLLDVPLPATYGPSADEQ